MVEADTGCAVGVLILLNLILALLPVVGAYLVICWCSADAQTARLQNTKKAAKKAAEDQQRKEAGERALEYEKTQVLRTQKLKIREARERDAAVRRAIKV